MNNLTVYGFTAGRIKCLESKYLNDDDLERLLGAETLDGIKGILADTFYSFLVEVRLTEEKEVKHRLELFLSDHFRDLTFNLPDKRVCQIFLSLFDLHNFRTLFREVYFGLPALRLCPLYSFSEAEMRKIVMGEKEALPYSRWLREAEKIDEPSFLDAWLEKVCALERLKLAKSLGSEILEQWIKEEIKVLNFKAFWRWRYYLPAKDIKLEDFLVLLTPSDKGYYRLLLEMTEEEFLVFMSRELGTNIEEEVSLDKALSLKFQKYFEKASLKISDPALIYFYLARRVKEVELVEIAVFSKLRNWESSFLEKVVRNYV